MLATARIFISYSRKDMVFADRLEAALKARGYEPEIDRAGDGELPKHQGGFSKSDKEPSLRIR